MTVRQRLLGALAGAILAGALVAAVATGSVHHGPGASAAPVATPSATPNPFAAGGLQNPAGAASVEVGKPVAVRIPSLGVSSPLESLHVEASGQLDAPSDYDTAGWYADGPAPGAIGPAIIAGHIDSKTGPAVFYRLGELEVGDTVIVDTDRGQSLTFTVTGRMQSPKSSFPSADVYSNVPRPELRLITCAGSFDRSVGHYTDNLIVFAALTS